MQANLINSASAIASALVTLQAADANASTVKYSAVLDFATLVAADVRRVVNSGSNLETDGKGRVVAVMDASKANRLALVAALVEAGAEKKDSDNIASLAATASRHFVTHMLNVGSLQAARSEQDMRDALAESFAEVTGSQATYNALEKARSRKWLAPEPVADASETDGQLPDLPSEEADPFTTEPAQQGEAPPLAPEPEAPSLDTVARLNLAAQILLEAAKADMWADLEAADVGDTLAEFLNLRRAHAKAEKAKAA